MEEGFSVEQLKVSMVDYQKVESFDIDDTDYNFYDVMPRSSLESFQILDVEEKDGILNQLHMHVYSDE